MGKKSRFEMEVEEISKLNRTEKGEVKSSAYSGTILTRLGDALVNSPDFKGTNIVKKGDEKVTTEVTPVADFRNGLKKLVKDEFGIDATEAEKLDTCTMPKSIGKAVGDMTGYLIRGYMETGKAYRFPMTSETEARMQIKLREIPEEIKETRKTTEVSPGVYKSVPTGKTIKTKKHTELCAQRKIPEWLKEQVN